MAGFFKRKTLFIGLFLTLSSFLIGLILYVFLQAGLYSSQDPAAFAKETQILQKLKDEGLPVFSYRDIQGNSVQSSQLKGRLLLVHFWASWCEPCLEEFPDLSEFSHQNKSQIRVLAISIDDEERDIYNFLKSFRVESSPHFQIVWDRDKKLSKTFGLSLLPESYVFSKKGELIRKLFGPQKWNKGFFQK